MALSEHEQQMLDEMERRLYQSEADVMHTASGSRRRVSYRALVLGIVVALVGVGVLIGGVAAQQLWLGLIGFAVMLGGAVLVFSPRGEEPVGDARVEQGPGGAGDGGAAARETLSERMERRWNERMEGER
ncbi:DUF3040 domain-containing protein [Leucobacter sp. CSA1]|uniref:DUF3040 domain-containing protein n=1 Tax=Leucobacter chromiisoli TaxID=2796471 RepID=A0A934Q845_9MICO|nr:DUF3040 domain-containing protein [Leucobacter chromiisoli]MBK0419218.1 DUF3040 domain-containing protein [Leucobacter chromiisoli]